MSGQPEVTVMVAKWFGDEITQYVNEEEASNTSVFETTMIGDSEALYEVYFDAQIMTWIYEGWLYKVSSANTEITKDELVQIAEQIKTK